MKNNHNDKSARYALLVLVARRNKFMKYLKRTNVEEYDKVVSQLGLRRK
jgi:ribosomal protein S15